MNQWKLYCSIITICALVNVALLCPRPTRVKGAQFATGQISATLPVAQSEDGFVADTGRIRLITFSSASGPPATSWNTPSNAASENGIQTSSLLPEDDDGTPHLIGTGLVTPVPLDATITGIKVTYKARATDNGANPFANVFYVVKSGSIAGAGLTVNVLLSGTLTEYSAGGPGQMFGTTLTPAEANASTSGIAINFRKTNTPGFISTIYVDVFDVTYYYTPGATYGTGAGVLPGFSATAQSKTIARGSAILPGLTGKAHHRVN